MKTTKLLFFIGLFISWAFVVALFIAGFLLVQNKNTTTETSQQTQTAQGNTQQQLVLSPQEIAKHNSQTSCWMTIEGKVYDVTSYFGSHPGGTSWLAEGCGIDATQLYNTKGGQGSPHSGSAHQLLINFYLGNLNQQVAVQAVQNKTNALANQTYPREKDDEWEDD